MGYNFAMTSIATKKLLSDTLKELMLEKDISKISVSELAKKAGVEDRFEVSSAAVSTEETGNDIYPPAKLKLREHGIPFGPHRARQLTREEYEYNDKVICADYDNITYIPDIAHQDFDDIVDYFDTDEKTSLMMQWVGERRDVSDPWYTRNFEAAYQDIYIACKAILENYSED
jgi:protein-tyrosine phosphatase